MNTRLAWSLALALAALPASTALAGEAYLQSYTYSGSGPVNAAADFHDYSGPGVILQADDAGAYPLQLLAIDVLYVAHAGPATSQEPWDVDIFSIPDAGLDAIPTYYGDIYSAYTMYGVSAGFVAPQMNRWTFQSPITLSGPVFLRLRHVYDDQTLPYEGTVALDESPPVPGVNYWSASNIAPIDLATPDSGLPSGNWIIRGVIPGPDIDAGSTTTTTTSSGSTSSSSGSTGTTGTTGTSSSSSSSSSGGTSGSGTTTGGSSTGGSTTGTTGTITLTSVSPNTAHTGDDTSISLIGSNFQFGVQAVIGPTALTNPDLKSPALLVATLPHGTAPGTYDVTVVNPNGEQATLHNAFTVTEGGGSGSSGGTAGGTNGAKSGGCGCSTTPEAALFALPVLLLGLRRRKLRA